MNLPLDPEFSSGFFDEIQTALPQIRGYVQKYRAFSLDSESIFEAYRLTHSMRNSGSMLQLHRVRNLATELEAVFESLGEAMTPIDEAGNTLILATLDEIERCLNPDAMTSEDSELIEPLRAYRGRLSHTPSIGTMLDPSFAPEWDRLPSLEDPEDLVPPVIDQPIEISHSGLDIPAPPLPEPPAPEPEIPSPELAEPPVAEVAIPAPEFAEPPVPEPEPPVEAIASGLDVPPPVIPGLTASVFDLPVPALEPEPEPEPDSPLPMPSFSGIDTAGLSTILSLELTTDPEIDPPIPTFELPLPLPPSDPTPLPGSISVPAPASPATRAAGQPPPELLEVFLLEAEDHFRNITEALPRLRENPDNRDHVQAVRRSVHTLKGTAGLVGFQSLTQLAHRMEDLLDLLYEGEKEVTPDIIQLLFTSADMLDDLTRGTPDQEKLKGLYDQFAAHLADTEQVTEAPPAIVPAEVEAPESAETPVGTQAGQYLRVPIARIDELVKLVSELVIHRSEFEQKLTSLTRHLDELKLSTTRLRKAATKLETEYEVRTLGGRLFAQGGGVPGGSGTDHTMTAYRPHGFDDLEFDRYTDFHLITRDLSETTTDLQTVGTELSTLYGDFDGYLNRQTHLTSELQDKLMRARMLPLSSLTPRLARTVRNVADEQGKEVELLVEGQNTELDKTVLEEMAEPFLHLLRNAVDHGIEPPDERLRAGKPGRGTIRVKAYPQGAQVVIQIIDDGRGIDPRAVRESAVTKGWLTPAEAEATSDADAIQLVLRPGFSLAREITQISGRGVGLDIVAAQVHRLKGTLGIETHLGLGTTFTVRLPLTLAVMRALMVKVHGQSFAIPFGYVRTLQRLDPSETGMLGQDEIVRFGEKIYPKIHLGKALKLKPVFGEVPTNPPVVVLEIGDRSIALVVDELVGGREIVVKNLGNHLRRVHGVSGATLLGDGTVALIVNPPDLLGYREAKPRGLTPSRSAAAVRPRGTASGDLRVLVVDDSPSVRRIVTMLFNNLGWKTIPAKDGLDALEVLHHAEEVPDAVMLDVEMPRMDGYELLSTLRSNPNYKDLPVVMVTSRAHEKHRRKAMDLGASAYLVKPYQEENLIRILRDLVRNAPRPVTSNQ